MKSIMTSLGGMLLLTLLALPALVATAEEKDTLPGLYACRGTNPHGGAYEGRVEIAERKGLYHVKWTVGEQTYVGVALREGDVLSVAWGIPHDGGTAVGVVAYKIEKGGTLTGRWTVLGGDNSIMKETLRKIPDA
mgnify:CR=1 FL=1